MLRDAWDRADLPQRMLYGSGLVLIVVGAAHLGVALVDSRPWEGPLSWRKPALFGISFGLTAVTIGWMLSFVRVRGLLRAAVAGLLSTACAAEVALVSLQAWRGVPSHFNVLGDAFDEAVFSAMGMSVAVIALAIVVVTVASFVAVVDAPPSLAWAIRLGLVLLVASQAVGGTIISNGLAHVQATGDIAGANLYGGVGAMKVPHAVTLHAAQVLPGLAWVLRATAWSERRRLRLVLLAAGGYTALVAVSLLQTYRARATFALDAGTTVLAAVGVAALAAAAATAVVGLSAARRRRATA